MSQVKVTRVKVYDELSDETVAFSCEVHVDGRKVADCKNDGRGGCHMWTPWAAVEQLNQIAKAHPAREDWWEFEPGDSLVTTLVLQAAEGAQR